MKPLGYHDLMEAFSGDGCAVCHILEISTERFITYLLADRVIDHATHQAIRARRGLCNQHISALIQRRGIVLPLAIYYKSALDEIVRVMEALPEADNSQRLWSNWLGAERSSGIAVADQLEPAASCLICADAHTTEARIIETLCEYVTSNPMKDAFSGSQGFCLPHLIQALRAARNAATVDLLIRTQRTKWEVGAQELDVFIAKLNHARRDEAKGHEGGSLLRAIKWMAGLAGVFGQDPRKR